MSSSEPTSSLRQLRPEAVRDTVLRLQGRIRTRFPDRHLGDVCDELLSFIEELVDRPRAGRWRVVRIISRVLMAALIVGLIVTAVLITSRTASLTQPERVWDWVQIVESTVNDVIFISIALFFLWQLPSRIERRYDLAALYRLRTLAHVIDMHQLTKDPERFRSDFEKTSASVTVGMTAIQLANYLDYCSEMLSLVGKAAALYSEYTNDAAVLATVSGIEELTSNMSGEIWQKISLLPRDDGTRIMKA